MRQMTLKNFKLNVAIVTKVLQVISLNLDEFP
jgi:hypothetical protein